MKLKNLTKEMAEALPKDLDLQAVDELLDHVPHESWPKILDALAAPNAAKLKAESGGAESGMAARIRSDDPVAQRILERVYSKRIR